MRRIRRRLSLLLLCPWLAHAQTRPAEIRPIKTAAAPAGPATGVQLRVDGLDDDLKRAVIGGVELSQYATRKVSDAQIHRLYAKASEQVRDALQPYGYYDANVRGELHQVGPGQNGTWQVTLHVTPGAPVKVSRVELQLDARAEAIKAIRQAERTLRHFVGQPLNHGAYESARDALSGSLTANGFLDAKLLVHKVAVNRAEHSAIISLSWQAGPRYRYGQVHFEGSQFCAGFLDRYVPFKRGDYFTQEQLLALQQALNGADYFSVVNVLPDVDNAKHGTVDVTVQLTPAKRTIYSGGPFIGTDTGIGVRAGIERRWINDRGHKWKNELVLAQRLKTLSTLYTIPMPGSDQRSFNFGATYRDANTDTSKSRTLELVGNETRLWHGWTRTLGMHVLSGTFTVGKKGGEDDNALGLEHGRSTEVFGEATLTRKQSDNPTFVRHGWSLSMTARSTAGTLLSDASFSQLLASAKWIRAFAGSNRLILRGTVGATWTDDFTALPPQLRFFAGGAQSVRGYSFESIGPRNSYDRVIGGKNLAVASTEMEHYFTRNWGIAAFVDAGNAFDGTDYRPKIGAGLGARWLSPVGMIRVDLGMPIHDNRNHGIELGLTIGPDL